jgi:hypothetical protein
MITAGSMSEARPSEVAERTPVAWAALAICAVLVAILAVARRRAAGRRLLRSVRRAARAQPAALERGVPDGAGRVLVLHGVRRDGGRGSHRGGDLDRADDGDDGGRDLRRGDVDHLELVHVRPAPEDGARQRLQVRRLAWWEPRPDGVLEAREVAQDLWRIADDAGFVAERRTSDARGVERLNALLGRTTDRAATIRLRDEPLAWAALPFAVFFATFALILPLSDDPFSEGGGVTLAVVTWPGLTAWLFWRSARRALDPVD